MPDQKTHEILKKTSHDTLFDGDLYCYQHKNGYRFSIDAVLLAHFVQPAQDEIILDLGTGCGIVGLILLYRHQQFIASLIGFELQIGLAELAQENLVLNSFEEKMSIVQGDVRSILDTFSPESFSTVVCNPPFFQPGTGRQNSDPETLLARHQVACTLSEILAAASVVKNRGKFVIIYPAKGVAELVGMLSKHHLIAKRIQFIYSYPEKSAAARLVLIEAVKNGGAGVDVLAPFYIYQSKNGPYSTAMQKMYESKQS